MPQQHHSRPEPHGRQLAITVSLCQRQWQAALTNPLIGFGLCDLDRRLIEGNKALERLVGRTVRELREASVPIATHPDDREPSLVTFRAVVTGQQEWGNVRKRYIHRDG